MCAREWGYGGELQMWYAGCVLLMQMRHIFKYEKTAILSYVLLNKYTQIIKTKYTPINLWIMLGNIIGVQPSATNKPRSRPNMSNEFASIMWIWNQHWRKNNQFAHNSLSWKEMLNFWKIVSIRRCITGGHHMHTSWCFHPQSRWSFIFLLSVIFIRKIS